MRYVSDMTTDRFANSYQTGTPQHRIRLALQRYATKHRAKKGTCRRFVLAFLRDATAPVTSRQITEAWVKARGLRADDATFVLIRKRIGACLTALQADGRVEGAGHVGGYKEWRSRT